MRISDWSSDVCSSDLNRGVAVDDGQIVDGIGLALITGPGGDLAGRQFAGRGLRRWRRSAIVAIVIAAVLRVIAARKQRTGGDPGSDRESSEFHEIGRAHV